jgi:spore coat polysaccharide biosynthesis protein SpsF
METLRHVRAGIYILACPDDSAAEFAPLAARAGFELFTGSKHNVLGRYCAAINRYASSDRDCRVIRATGDNPFVFSDAADAINAEAAVLGADYAGYAGLRGET